MRQGRWVLISLATVAVIAVAAALFMTPTRFNSNAWKAVRGQGLDSPRGKMVRDLQQSHLKSGMSREAILQLLGEPDFEKTDSVYKYEIGAYSGMGIDLDTLDIEFDGNGVVTRWQIQRH